MPLPHASGSLGVIPRRTDRAPINPEAATREKIGPPLVAAGWAIQGDQAFSPTAARGIAHREVPLESGRCDYLLSSTPFRSVDRRQKGTRAHLSS
jgi:hypothetical protein